MKYEQGEINEEVSKKQLTISLKNLLTRVEEDKFEGVVVIVDDRHKKSGVFTHNSNITSLIKALDAVKDQIKGVLEL